MKGFVLWVLVLVLALSIVETCHGRQPPGSRWKVTIHNNRVNDSVLAHCKSKDDDLGEHILKVGEKYEWEFRENLWRTTLFWCYFHSNRYHASFEVFWPEKGNWLSEMCDYSNCIWFVDDFGFYLKNIPKNQLVFLQYWKVDHPK